jgi:hypothetical protein
VHIIVIIHWTFNVKVALNTILTNQFQIYLLPTFIILKLILYSIYQKLNWGLNGFVLILTKVFNLFFMFMSKFWFGKMTFLFTLPIFAQYRTTILGNYYDVSHSQCKKQGHLLFKKYKLKTTKGSTYNLFIL